MQTGPPYHERHAAAAMARRSSQTSMIWLRLCTGLTVILSLCSRASAQSSDAVTQNGTRWIQYTGNDGTVWLDDDRQPALYTQSFGDCQGDGLLNVTRFDAAYYKDNMTVLFHLGGNTALANEDIMCKSRSHSRPLQDPLNIHSIHRSFRLRRVSF